MSDLDQFEKVIAEQCGAAALEKRGGTYVQPSIRLALFAWQASRRAALEEAAKVCDDLGFDRWNLYKGRAPYTGREDGRANSYVEGESDGAGKCSVAIRAIAKHRDQP